LYSIVFGTVLSIVTIVIHTLGTTAWIEFLRRNSNSFRTRFGEFKLFSGTATALLLLHAIEVVVWAAAYLVLVGGSQFPDFESATYFSAVTFTSLGYGDVVIVGPWRMLSAIQAMTGLLVFGWSTALLFAIVQRVWQEKYDDA